MRTTKSSSLLKKQAEEAFESLQHLLVKHGCASALAAITDGVTLIEAAHATLHRPDLEEQRNELPEYQEIAKVLDEFVEDAKERGYAAAAFDVLFAAALCAADATIAEEETQWAAQRARKQPSSVVN